MKNTLKKLYTLLRNQLYTLLRNELYTIVQNTHPSTIRNLWTMMAHLNGHLLNASSLGNSLGLTTPTIIRYVNFLEEAFLLKSLHAFSWNIKKRLVKTSKVYLTDTGILHHLVGVKDFSDLSGNPIIGSSWESFVINQVHALKNDHINLYFYRTHQGAEIDLVFTKGFNVIATAEMKYSNSPQLTKGNFQAIEDLKSQLNFIITPSSDDFMAKEHIRVCSLKSFISNYLPYL